ncbi:MAG: YceI family protein [Isosphaeraceae bacterium]
MQRMLIVLAVCGGMGEWAIRPSWAQEKPAAAPASAGVSALQVDLASSRVYVKVGSTSRLGHEHGIIGRLAAGSVTLGGPGDLVFDMRTFVADLPEARRYVGLTGSVSASDQQKTTGNMLSKDVLAVAQYPTAKYQFRSATPLDGQPVGEPGRYQLDGVFTLHGAALPLPLTATLEKTTTPGALRMRTAFAILQSQFGITPYSALGGLVGVTDRLDIWGDLILRTATGGR